VSNFIPVEADGNPFYIQVLPAEGQTGIKQRSRDPLTEKLTKDDFKQMIRQAVMPACQTFVDVWQELNQPLTAESAEVEFNLGFTASGSAVIVQASGQASFKVKVSWKFTSNSLQENLRSNLIKQFDNDTDLLESELDSLMNVYQESTDVSHQDKIKILQDIKSEVSELKKFG
jgi:hypothetical protein